MTRGVLRRQDRAMDREACERLMDRALVGRVGTVGPDGWPYVTPVNFVHDAGPGRIYLHCATSGHLLDNLASSPLACFEVDEPGDILDTGPNLCETTQIYQSVISFGRGSVLGDEGERLQALRMFAMKYVDRLMPGRSYSQGFPTAGATAMLAIQVEQMTGKARLPRAG